MQTPPALPQAWLDLFDGEGLEHKLGEAAILASTDEEGWPHQAYLSVGEVYAPGPGHLYLATWPSSRTARNLERAARATLSAAVEGVVWEARLAVERCAGEGEGPALFRAQVLEVRRHEAPYARVERLIGFRLLDEAAVVERWRKQLIALRRQAESDAVHRL